MLGRRFEGSFLGDAGRIAPTAVLECKICWHVYDPAAGCEVWQVPAGTPFAALPAHWRCPKCDGDRDQFMVIDVGAVPAGETAEAAAGVPVGASADGRLATLAAAAATRFEAVFREVHSAQMRGVPIVNNALSVKAVGFGGHDGRVLGMLVTPWFMNIVLAPGPGDDWSGLVPGAKELIEFPSGLYQFVAANRPGAGPYKACSLFSPMFEFTSMLQATETAAAAVVALFDPAVRDDGDRPGDARRARDEAARVAVADASEASAAVGAAGAAAHVSTAEPAAREPAPAPTRRALILGPGLTAAVPRPPVTP